MKNLYVSLAALSLTLSLSGQQAITSVANGNATSPFTWSCTCIPADGDTITINHNVTVDVDYAYTMGGIIIGPNGSATGNSGSRILGLTGGFFTVNGDLNVAFFYQGGGTAVNNGNVTILGNLGIDGASLYTNNSSVVVGDTLWVNTFATYQNNGTTSSSEVGTAGTVNNAGSFTTGNVLNTGTFTNTGSQLQLTGSLYNTGTVTLSTNATVNGDVWNAEIFNVSSYLSAASLINGDTIFGTATFTNNGTISLSNSLYNSEDITGSGDFCVVDSTVNSGAITGTVDICDLSGGGWDLNFGTEAGTVTHCANGPCTIGITETMNTTITMVPNPSHEMIRLELPRVEVGSVEVIDVTGRVVMTDVISGSSMLLNILQLPEGIYTVQLTGQDMNYTGRFVKE
jgi:hypothetical protein